MNSTLFSTPSVRTPSADALNHENAPAYAHTSEHALIQLAFTGCFHSTFYVKDTDQLANAKKLASEVSPRRLAQIAIAGRENGFMKDAPAFLLAVLANRDPKLFAAAFPRVVDNPKMLRTYTQMALSGQAGRLVNLASGVHRRMYQKFFDRLSPEAVFNGDIGDKPSLVNILRLAHVRPNNRAKEAVFTYLFNREFGWKHDKGKALGSTYDDLPQSVKDFDAFKSGQATEDAQVPDVDYRLIEGLNLSSKQWAEVFTNAKVYMLVKNLATAQRHGVFDVPGMEDLIVNKLRDREAVLRSRLFPNQVFQSYLTNKGKLPYRVLDALQDTLDMTLEKIPSLGKVFIACDVSYSMSNPYTGNQDVGRYGHYSQYSISSKTRIVDVAALIASALLRSNRDAILVPFSNSCFNIHLNPRDSVATNAEKLSALLGGGTNCSAPLELAKEKGLKFDTFVLISDNESWIDASNPWSKGNGTRLHASWQETKKRLPKAKMVNIDLTPNTSTQVKERPDILQVGGFSDAVFEVMSAFHRGGNSSDFWASELDKIEI